MHEGPGVLTLDIVNYLFSYDVAEIWYYPFGLRAKYNLKLDIIVNL